MQTKGCFILILSVIVAIGVETPADELKTRNVVFVTLDGLRWQEVFGGAEARLMNRENGGVRDVDELRRRFWDDSVSTRRKRLMPFFWSTIVRNGQVLGDPERSSIVRVTNERYFSYPGYNELLAGFADSEIDSNAKQPNRNVTVLEWLNRRPEYQGRVAAIGSWDVFPYILNAERSGIYVNAGWQDLEFFENQREQEQWNLFASEVPRYWNGVRYDAFTIRGALEYLRQRRPRVLYVALGETDDWAHDGRYDLYLDAAHRNDRYISQLWEAVQDLEGYRGTTSMVITTDHGRGGDREGWKSHGASVPGSEFIWVAVIGPDTKPMGVLSNVSATQSQIAATVAALLGEDFAASDPRIAARLPGVLGEFEASPDDRK